MNNEVLQNTQVSRIIRKKVMDHFSLDFSFSVMFGVEFIQLILVLNHQPPLD